MKNRRNSTLDQQETAPALLLHDVECASVPGTTDRVRFTLLQQGQSVRAQVRELAVSRLTAMFGRSLDVWPESDGRPVPAGPCPIASERTAAARTGVRGTENRLSAAIPARLDSDQRAGTAMVWA